MSSFFHHASVTHDNDVVCLSNGRKSVRNHNGRPILRHLFKGFLNDPFSPYVDGTRRLIQNQNHRLSDNTPRDCEALSLATGKLDATFADFGQVSL